MEITAIRTIIKNNPDVLSTREKARAFLSDVFLNDQIRINVMMNAYDVGVIEAIKNPTSFSINQVLSGIESRYGVSEVRAKEAVEIWISILSPDIIDISDPINNEGKSLATSTNISGNSTVQQSASQDLKFGTNYTHPSTTAKQTTTTGQNAVANSSQSKTTNQKTAQQPTTLHQTISTSSTQPSSSSVQPTIIVQKPQQPITQNTTIVSTQPSLAATPANTYFHQTQQTVAPNYVSANTNIQKAKSKRAKATAIVAIISVGSLFVLGVFCLGLSKILQARTDAIAQSEREESRSIAQSEREESIALVESETAAPRTETSRTETSETTNNSSEASNNITQYVNQEFDGISFEVPSDSSIETGDNVKNDSFSNTMVIGFPSESSGIIMYSLDITENEIEVNAGTEEYTVRRMKQDFLNNNNATNIEGFETRVNGMLAGCAHCYLNSMPTEVYLFCSNDYTKMYIVLFQVYNTSKYTTVDEEYFNHFIGSINTTRYIEQSFEGLSFEVPADSLIDYNRDNPDESFAQSMLIEFISDSSYSYIMIFSIDISEKEIDASTEQTYVRTTLQNYLENKNAEDISSVSNMNIDGKLAEQVLCYINDKMTDVYVFLSKDYSKLYIIVFQVYDLSVEDRVNFNYFIDSITVE